MMKYTYDLHNHSCLSPCADNDSTPNNIAGMAYLSGIKIFALTDHNTAKNCPAFFEAAQRYGIIPVAGIELTTSEDIHLVCLFEQLESAMKFDEYLATRRVLIKNRTDIFGEQLILNGEDEVIGEEEYFLPNATTISLDEAPSLVKGFGGVCYPAHIDRDSNGIIAILGTLPPTPIFNCVEMRSQDKIDEYTEKYGLSDKVIVINSDSHYLTDINETNIFFELNADPDSPDEVRRELFKLLK
jgi:hypothetical protein